MNLKAFAAAALLTFTGGTANAAYSNNAKEYSAQFRAVVARLNNNTSDKVHCEATAELRTIQNENKWVGEQTRHMGWNQTWHDRQAEVKGNVKRCVRLGYIKPRMSAAEQLAAINAIVDAVSPTLSTLSGPSSSNSSVQVTTADWRAFCAASRSPDRIYRNTGSHGCWNGASGGTIYNENEVKRWIRNGRGAR